MMSMAGKVKGQVWNRWEEPFLRAKSLSAAVQPNLISVLGQRISKGAMSAQKNERCLCVTGQQQAFRPGREKGDEPTSYKACFCSPSYCGFVSTLSSTTSSLAIDHMPTRDPTMEKYMLLPTMSPSSLYPQLSLFLILLTRFGWFPVSGIIN